MGISVLMSVYDAENPTFLSRALQSIWDDQIIKPDEIVLIQDGPVKSEIKEILELWKKRLGDKFILIENETNIGLTRSLNKGIQKASSTYIARMDTDDISTPERFKVQQQFLDKNDHIHVVGGSIMEFDSLNDNLGIRRYPKDNNSVLKYIYKASPLAHPTVMMRKSIFDAGLSYNEKYRTSQDIALWFDVLRGGYSIANVDNVILKFRRDGNVFKRRSKAKAKNELEIYLRGIRNIYGLVTWKYVFPLARYCFRMMPVSIVKFIYGTKFRTILLQ